MHEVILIYLPLINPKLFSNSVMMGEKMKYFNPRGSEFREIAYPLHLPVSPSLRRLSLRQTAPCPTPRDWIRPTSRRGLCTFRASGEGTRRPLQRP